MGKQAGEILDVISTNPWGSDGDFIHFLVMYL